MTKSACNLMKIAVVLAVALALAGGSLVFVAQHLSLETVLPAVFVSLGFFSIITGILVLLGTALAILLPNVSRQLDLCQH